MKHLRIATTLGLSLLLASPLYARQAQDQANEQNRKATTTELKQQENTSKSQAKADKATRKAAGSHKAKKAAKDQDKANATAAQSPQ